MNGRGACEALHSALQRFDTPVGGVFHVNVEGRFVELDDVHTVGLQSQRLLVQQLRESKGHFDFVTVKTIRHRVDDGHRAGQGELELLLRVGAGELRLQRVDAAFEIEL